MKCIKFFLLLFLVSCSKPKKQNEYTLAISKGSIIAEPQKEKAAKLKTEIDTYFDKIVATVIKNESGGGDCWNTYTEYKTETNDYYAIKDNLDCGDYGFTNYRLILSAQKEAHLLHISSKEWRINDTKPYLIKEWIVDFNDTSKVYYRQFAAENFGLSIIPDSVSFHLPENKNLNLSATLESIEYHRIANKE